MADGNDGKSGGKTIEYRSRRTKGIQTVFCPTANLKSKIRKMQKAGDTILRVK
jgi:hypothetical protein